MKIDGNRPTQDTDATEAAKKTALDKAVTRTTSEKIAPAGDRVEVSADAKLLAAATDAARKSPEVRTELVERMKQKLAAGELGNDSGRLADRIIDDLLKK